MTPPVVAASYHRQFEAQHEPRPDGLSPWPSDLRQGHVPWQRPPPKEVQGAQGLSLVLTVLVLVSACFCCGCVRRFLAKKRDAANNKGNSKNKLDLKTLQMLGKAYEEQFEEDNAELLANEEVDLSTSNEETKKKKQLGKIKYKVEFDFANSVLIVNVIECSDLPAMDIGGTSDPYVKIYLLPDKKRKLETKVHRRTLNPVFNENFRFEMSYGEVMARTLVLAVYDYDRFSKHDAIGELRLPICQLDLVAANENWAELHSIKGDGALGDICLSLRYVPASGKLTVVVLEARNLKKMDVGGLSDPYVKIALMQNGKRLRKKKTSIKKCTLNPYYNESFSFEIPFEHIQKVQLLVTVVDYDRVGASEPIGQVLLASDSKNKGALRHWTSMYNTPRRPVAQWHVLRPMHELDVDKNNKFSKLLHRRAKSVDVGDDQRPKGRIEEEKRKLRRMHEHFRTEDHAQLA